ncbi:stage II sporulation protein M [Thalassotalea sp. PLHSN55]|uniref:stage II sporulation protein M n=1 Tax=Thalassotalea sp. PLHSN55 TaxID=3435888 RepID=UPI003F8706A7
MKQSHFVKTNEQRWQNFSQLCLGEKGKELPANFGQLYRQICHDLAIARSRHYSPSLIEKLDNFVTLGQSHLYRGENLSLRAIYRLFKQSFMQGLFENRYYLWLSFGAFFGFAFIIYLWVIFDPNAVYHFLDVQSVKSIEKMYDPAGSVQQEARSSGANVMMLGVYIYNNIGIAFQMFGGGALFGFGAVLPLLFNSFYFGAISAHIVHLGYQETFFSFVITHGSFELTAITIAGAAGGKIGFNLLNPGQFSRAYAVKKAGKTVLPLIVGAFVMLVLAAIIEAFWSPLDIPSIFKYIAGSLCWFYVLRVFYRGTRYGH